MISAIEKTKNLDRVMLPVEVLIANELNPNEMGDREFNLLVDNIEQVGITDPILVRPIDDGKYRIVGGHHRLEAAKMMGFEEVPCTVITDADFDSDKEAFQVVRHNIIRGKLSPSKFMALYKSMEGKYSEEVASELFGFAQEEEFKKLIQKTEKSLPLGMQAEFKEAAKEIKTVNDLAKVLNELFYKGGDDLAYGFMVFDFEGKTSIWCRMKKGQLEQFQKLASSCKEAEVAVDDVMSRIIEMVVSDDFADKFEAILGDCPNIVKEESPSVTGGALDG